MTGRQASAPIAPVVPDGNPGNRRDDLVQLATSAAVNSTANPVLAVGALDLAGRQWPTAAFARARGAVR